MIFSHDVAGIWFPFYLKFVNFLLWFVNLFITKKVVSYPSDPILHKSVAQLKKLLVNREITSVEIIESYIKRIEEVNPIINAVVTKNYEEARSQAKLSDELISSLGDLELAELFNSKPLFGLPFTIKDSIKVKGKPCTVGCLYRKKEAKLQTENGVCVQRMFDAGAILLAISTVPETCLWIETNSQAHGKTCNPYDSRRIVGGSSGGEGALHGAGASLMGIGSDLSGSIRIPSYCNGVFGFLCTPKKVPLEGHMPGFPDEAYSSHMTKIGPITRFSEDFSLLIDVLTAGEVNQVPKTRLKKLRIFYLDGLAHNKIIEPVQKIPMDAMKRAIAHFEKKFGVTAQSISLPETKDHMEMEWLSIFELHRKYPNIPQLMSDLETIGEPVNCKLELLKWFFGQSEYSLTTIALGLHPYNTAFSDEKIKKLTAKREKFKRRIYDLLGDDGVIFFPSWPTQVPYHFDTIVKHTSVYYTGIVNLLLVTAVQCPMGITGDLPDGVQVMANQGSEKLLLDVAQEISDKFGGWTPPGK